MEKKNWMKKYGIFRPYTIYQQVNGPKFLKNNCTLVPNPNATETSISSLLFATRLVGPRINAHFEFPSHCLFVAWRGDMNSINSVFTGQIVYSNICMVTCVVFWVVALWARMRTSLHTSPMLSINCPVSHKLLTPIPIHYSSQPHTSTHVIYFKLVTL